METVSSVSKHITGVEFAEVVGRADEEGQTVRKGGTEGGKEGGRGDIRRVQIVSSKCPLCIFYSNTPCVRSRTRMFACTEVCLLKKKSSAICDIRLHVLYGLYGSRERTELEVNNEICDV